MLDRPLQSLGIGVNLAKILHQTKSIRRQSVPWRLGILIHKHVRGLVEPASENVPPLARLIPAPLFHVSGHVIGPEWIDSSQAAHANWTAASKITELHAV